MELHKEIFVDGLLRIDDFEDVRINPKSIFFKLIKEVSIFNRCFDMNYIYAIAHEEKEALEKTKCYVGLAALPFAISGGGFVKALQSSVALVSNLCDIDSAFRLSDKLFEFKGPVVISGVYWKNWRNYRTTDDNWDEKWQTPTLDPAYDSNDLGSKKDALEKFVNLKTILNFK